MTQEKSREVFHDWLQDCIDNDPTQSSNYTTSERQSWEAGWQASRADVVKMLESEEMLEAAIYGIAKSDGHISLLDDGDHVANYKRDAKAALAAIAEKVRGK